MSLFKSWNFHPLEGRGQCQCKSMGGNTFVTVSNEDGLPQPAFVLQIDDNKNFTISLFGALDEQQNASIVALGRWTCCLGKWVGVAVAIARTSNPNVIYRRITVEVDTDTLVARIRTVLTAVPIGQCIGSYADDDTQVGDIDTVQLQVLGQNCASDFELESSAS